MGDRVERLCQEYVQYTKHFEDNDLGLAKFDLFCRSFDIYAGEPTLERSRYPPDYHTYDELPILKYDGYVSRRIQSLPLLGNRTLTTLFSHFLYHHFTTRYLSK